MKWSHGRENAERGATGLEILTWLLWITLGLLIVVVVIFLIFRCATSLTPGVKPAVTLTPAPTVIQGQPATFTVRLDFNAPFDNNAPSTITVQVWEDEDLFLDPDELLIQKVDVPIPRRSRFGEATFTLSCDAQSRLIGDPATIPGKDSETFGNYEVYVYVPEQTGVVATSSVDVIVKCRTHGLVREIEASEDLPAVVIEVVVERLRDGSRRSPQLREHGARLPVPGENRGRPRVRGDGVRDPAQAAHGRDRGRGSARERPDDSLGRPAGERDRLVDEQANPHPVRARVQEVARQSALQQLQCRGQVGRERPVVERAGLDRLQIAVSLEERAADRGRPLVRDRPPRANVQRSLRGCHPTR
jgi:hypothetical protein